MKFLEITKTIIKSSCTILIVLLCLLFVLFTFCLNPIIGCISAFIFIWLNISHERNKSRDKLTNALIQSNMRGK